MSKEIKIPGLIDTHVHLRDPGSPDKEDFGTGTGAAAAGGVVVLLDMPNNLGEPTVTLEALNKKMEIAAAKAHCDYGLYAGADQKNYKLYSGEIVEKICGLKMYLDVTTGELWVRDLLTLMRHFKCWPGEKPICVHAEDSSMAMVLGLMAAYKDRPVHFCHVSQASEVLLIKKAKENGLPVTCEVTPHHLFLTQEDEDRLGPFGLMKPPLRTKNDQEALWLAINQGIVDTIASDHAPHTLEEKWGDDPPSGVPGLETTLPLLLTAVAEEKLSMKKLVELTSINPARIFHIDRETYLQENGSCVVVDLEERYFIENSNLFTKCGWSPFDGKQVKGRVREVWLRGEKVYEDGKVLAPPGFGKGVSYIK